MYKSMTSLKTCMHSYIRIKKKQRTNIFDDENLVVYKNCTAPYIKTKQDQSNDYPQAN